MKKILEAIFGAAILAGFVVILCAAGLSDHDALEWSEIVARCGVGVALILVGFVGADICGAGFIE